MRGYMYEVRSDIDSCFSMDETDFYAAEDALAVDHVADVETIGERVQLVQDLLSNFASYGATFTIESYDDGGAIVRVPSIEFSIDFKLAYFRPRLERAKACIAEISLSEFAGNSDKNNLLYKLKTAIEDDFSDCVYLDGSWYTMDSFLRNAIPGKKYYFGNVVLLH